MHTQMSVHVARVIEDELSRNVNRPERRMAAELRRSRTSRRRRWREATSHHSQRVAARALALPGSPGRS